MGVSPDKPCLLSSLQAHLAKVCDHPFVAVLNRLDAPVSGAVLVGLTREAARFFSPRPGSPPDQQDDQPDSDSATCVKNHQRTYWALLPEPPEPSSGQWCDYLVDDARHRKVHVTTKDPPAKHAQLAYRTLATLDQTALVEFQLITGRKHQVRVQAASRNLPILGDRKYGSRRVFENGIALHAVQCEFIHPISKERIKIVAPVPADWPTSATSYVKALCTN